MGMVLFLNPIYLVSKVLYLCLLHVNYVSVGNADLRDVRNRDSSVYGD